MSAQLWPNNLPPPVFGGDNFRIAQAMSLLCKGRVPDFDEARRYAMEQCADGKEYEPIAYADRRG